MKWSTHVPQAHVATTKGNQFHPTSKHHRIKPFHRRPRWTWTWTTFHRRGKVRCLVRCSHLSIWMTSRSSTDLSAINTSPSRWCKVALWVSLWRISRNSVSCSSWTKSIMKQSLLLFRQIIIWGCLTNQWFQTTIWCRKVITTSQWITLGMILCWYFGDWLLINSVSRRSSYDGIETYSAASYATSNKELLHNNWAITPMPPVNVDREGVVAGQEKIVRAFAELMKNMSRMKAFIRWVVFILC